MNCIFLLLSVQLAIYSLVVAQRDVWLVRSYKCLIKWPCWTSISTTSPLGRRCLFILGYLSFLRSVTAPCEYRNYLRTIFRLYLDHNCILVSPLGLRFVVGLLLWPYDLFHRILRLILALLDLVLGQTAPY